MTWNFWMSQHNKSKARPFATVSLTTTWLSKSKTHISLFKEAFPKSLKISSKVAAFCLILRQNFCISNLSALLESTSIEVYTFCKITWHRKGCLENPVMNSKAGQWVFSWARVNKGRINNKAKFVNNCLRSIETKFLERLCLLVNKCKNVAYWRFSTITRLEQDWVPPLSSLLCSLMR